MQSISVFKTSAMAIPELCGDSCDTYPITTLHAPSEKDTARKMELNWTYLKAPSDVQSCKFCNGFPHTATSTPDWTAACTAVKHFSPPRC